MHLFFVILLTVLVIWWVWGTCALIFWLFMLAGHLFVLAFWLLVTPFRLLIAGSIELIRYLKRRQLASTVGLDAVTVTLEQELTREPPVVLAQNRNGVWEPLQ
jgi:hypothetical protein